MRIKQCIVEIHYLMKGNRICYIISYIGFLLIPLILYSYKKSGWEADVLERRTLLDLQVYLPLIASVPGQIIIYSITEKGNALFYMYRRNKLFVLSGCDLLTILLLIIEWCFVKDYISMNAEWILVRILIIHLFHETIIYFTGFLTKGISMSAVLVLLFSIHAYSGYQSGAKLSYFYDNLNNQIVFWKSNIPWMILSVLFLVLGIIANHYYPEKM